MCPPAGIEAGYSGNRLRGKPRAVGLAEDERLLVLVVVGVETACRAVARRGARHRQDRCGCSDRRGVGQAGYFRALAPRAVDIGGDERLRVVVGVGVEPAGQAVAEGPAGDRVDLRRVARIELLYAGDQLRWRVERGGDESLIGGADGCGQPDRALSERRAQRHRGDPGFQSAGDDVSGEADGLYAVPDIVDAGADPGTLVARGVMVEPANGTVIRNRACQRGDQRLARAEVRYPATRQLDRLPPGATVLGDDERLPVLSGVRVMPAGAAVTRRRARQRVDPDRAVTRLQRGQINLVCVAPMACWRTDLRRDC